MFTSTTMKDGNVQMVELHLCLRCKRMMVLNDEPHYRVYVPKWQGFGFVHKRCPPLKEQLRIR